VCRDAPYSGNIAINDETEDLWIKEGEKLVDRG